MASFLMRWASQLLMKKIDKLIITSFLGPFILTFFVVVFILLNIQMLKYFDDIIGKDLGWDVLGTLVFYFAIFTTPTAMPLAVLLSSLITFGNLGEHFELTAVKSLGISLVRSLLPIFIFVIFLTGIAFYTNNNLVPKAALEAYSLLYDIKQKKPALDLREGTFYNGIPDISIKVNNKLPDGQTIEDIIIYDHRNKIGNKEVTIADSGKMYTILNDQYLKLELFNGYNYNEGSPQNENVLNSQAAGPTLSKTKFDKTQIVFDLSSFGLNRTDKKWFQGNRIMRNLNELDYDMDSINNRKYDQHLNLFATTQNQIFNYHFKQDTLPMPADLAAHKRKKDSLARLKDNFMLPSQMTKENALAEKTLPTIKAPTAKNETASKPAENKVRRFSRNSKSTIDNAKAEAVAVDSTLFQIRPELTNAEEPGITENTRNMNDSIKAIIQAKSDSIFAAPPNRAEIASALNYIRSVKSQMVNYENQINNYDTEFKIYQVQWHKILSNSLACIVMFLIGAPLGAIIKRGGLGVPVLASILFFIVFYILSMMGDKWSRQGIIPVPVGIWAADAILFVVGLIFLRQARLDARLFEADFYNVMWDKLKIWLRSKKLLAEEMV